MTMPSSRTHLLTRSRSLAAKGIQAAIIASPVFFAVAPSQALTLTRTFNGFTEAFAPANWTVDTSSGSSAQSATFTPTTLTMQRGVQNGTTPTVNYAVSSSLLESFKPDITPGVVNPGAVKFISGVFSYSWNIITNTPNNGGRVAYDFSQTETSQTPIEFAFTPANTNLTNISGTGDNIATALVDTNKFGWFLKKTNNTGGALTTTTATISNFVFTATYETVPGPLPLAGAAAAFAWSRRIRRRLKTAQASI